MPNIMVRAISGAIYVLLIVGLLILSPGDGFAILTTIFAILASIEYSSMTRPSRSWLKIIDAIATAGIVGCSHILLYGNTWIFIIIALLSFPLIRMAIQLFINEPQPLEQAARGATGVIYIGVPLAMIAFAASDSRQMVLLGFVMIWMNDTGAYLAGRTFGRHKLMERISPKKTVEGAIGGAFAATLTGIFAPLLFHSLPISPLSGAIMGLTVFALSTIGDLVESMIKREEGIKDSGKIIPGHGGILDRIDSLLFAAPAILLFVWI